MNIFCHFQCTCLGENPEPNICSIVENLTMDKKKKRQVHRLNFMLAYSQLLISNRLSDRDRKSVFFGLSSIKLLGVFLLPTPLAWTRCKSTAGFLLFYNLLVPICTCTPTL